MADRPEKFEFTGAKDRIDDLGESAGTKIKTQQNDASLETFRLARLTAYRIQLSPAQPVQR